MVLAAVDDPDVVVVHDVATGEDASDRSPVGLVIGRAVEVGAEDGLRTDSQQLEWRFCRKGVGSHDIVGHFFAG